ncbi:MAG: STN domain-containing protein, partial [Novosphingobium sp.]
MMVLNHPSTRRSYKRRLTCSVISVIIALSLTAGAAQAQARTQPTESARALSIPAGQLDTSIIELARTTGISIFVPPALVAGKRAGAVNGVMSPEQALVRLLKGTGVTFRRGADGGYVLVGQQSRPVSRAAQPIIAPKRGVVDAQLADESSDQVGGGEIVVTARRREES